MKINRNFKLKEFIKSEYFDYFLLGFGTGNFSVGVALGSGVFILIGAIAVIIALFSLALAEDKQ